MGVVSFIENWFSLEIQNCRSWDLEIEGYGAAGRYSIERDRQSEEPFQETVGWTIGSPGSSGTTGFPGRMQFLQPGRKW